MRARPDRPQEVDDVLDELVEAEAPRFDGNVAGVEPVDEIDVVVGQHRAHGLTHQGAEVSGQARQQQDFGLALGLLRLGEMDDPSERRGVEEPLLDRDRLARRSRRR